MIQLFNRTEYSFRIAFGHLDKVMALQEQSAGICDRGNTYGHVAWQKLCKKKNIKPIFGVELALVENPLKAERQGVRFVKLLAKNDSGLRQIYSITTKATEQFHLIPRIGIFDLEQLTDDVWIFTAKPLAMHHKNNLFLDLNPTTDLLAIQWAEENDISPVAGSDNFYPTADDKDAYEVCIGDLSEDKVTPTHILSLHEWLYNVKGHDQFKQAAITNAENMAKVATATLQKAELVHPPRPMTLEQMCREASHDRGINLAAVAYNERLQYELKLIKEKQYEDYFYLIADLCTEAKKTMLLSPARGSSCGSLVCYLLNITDIDPLKYDLLFERFIDVNRKDLPDIDIDFPDVKRDWVLGYLKEKYGTDCVAQLGTVNRFKAKSTILEVAKQFNIPAYEFKELKEAIIERAAGDPRVHMCIKDTFNQQEIGQKALAKYPHMAIATEIEGHAKHSGKHAAAIVVTSRPVNEYCSVDIQTGAAMVDKYDAEDLNLLKIDALGLRTLTVIEDCLAAAGKDKTYLHTYPLDDQKVFDILNTGKFVGIFQFEGDALKKLCNQMKITKFDDITALTAIGRPAPLMAGISHEWLQKRNGLQSVSYDYPVLETILNSTYGLMIYQEDIMRITKEVAGLSWEDVTAIRKAIAKSMGRAALEKYETQFVSGAVSNGFAKQWAEDQWGKIVEFGSYTFNKSHAVAYAHVSYWCMILKANFPLEYAASCLKYSKDDEQTLKLLRELHYEGITYKAFDQQLSQENWTVQDGVLIGGIMGIKGIGEKTAKSIAKKKRNGEKITPSQQKKLDEAVTPYDVLFECQAKWKHIFDNPDLYGISFPLTQIRDIKPEDDGTFVFIGKLVDKKQRDKNDAQNIKKRNGQIMQGNTLYMNIRIADDTDSIMCSISPWKYLNLGKPIFDDGKVDQDWFLVRGRNIKDYRIISIENIRKLN